MERPQNEEFVSGANGEFKLKRQGEKWSLWYRGDDVTARSGLNVTDVDNKGVLLQVEIKQDSNLPPLPAQFTLQLAGAHYLCLGTPTGCAAEIASWMPSMSK